MIVVRYRVDEQGIGIDIARPGIPALDIAESHIYVAADLGISTLSDLQVGICPRSVVKNVYRCIF